MSVISSIRSLFNWLHPIRKCGRDNVVSLSNPYRNIRIRIYGNNNIVRIEKASNFKNLNISIYGDNNSLHIKKNARIYGPCNISIESGAKVSIGENTGLRGVTILARSSNITIGNDCMTSYGVIIRNHDSHIVCDMQTGEELNPPKDIVIGDHVWMAQNVTVLKGVEIGANSVLGFGTVVTKNVSDNSIAVGNPVKIVKQGITWRK